MISEKLPESILSISFLILISSGPTPFTGESFCELISNYNVFLTYENKQIPGVFYIHSWELTPEFMPKIEIPKKDSFITYHNINKAYPRMENLLEKFEFTSFSKYIQENKEKLY